jgi:hypothetical protein
LDLESRYKRQSELFIPFLLERSYEVLNVDRLALKTAGCTDEEINLSASLPLGKRRYMEFDLSEVVCWRKYIRNKRLWTDWIIFSTK